MTETERAALAIDCLAADRARALMAMIERDIEESTRNADAALRAACDSPETLNLRD